MNILFIKSGKIVSVNDSYGLRLIEHGLAVIAPAPAKKAAPAAQPKAAQPKAEKPRRAKKQEG